jgi:acetate kinase
MKSSDIMDFLAKQVPVFADLPEEIVAQLVNESRVVTIEPQEALIECGDPARFLGVVLAGELEASVADNRGDRHRLALLETGALFGQMALMTDEPNLADVIGITPSQVLQVPHSVCMTTLLTNPKAVHVLSRSISKRLINLAYEPEGRTLAAKALQKSEDPYGLQLHSTEAIKILVINCGSSSLKYALFDTADPDLTAKGVIERIDTNQPLHTCTTGQDQFKQELDCPGHGTALAAMGELLMSPELGCVQLLQEVSVIGHRVVHGGARFESPVLITDEILTEIEDLNALAPLHNPVNVLGIRAAQQQFPNANHVAVFDTAFHHTLPPYAYLYGLPHEAYQQHGIRRFGFHGTSHAYAALKAAEVLQRRYSELEIVTCHLGNGASICAVDHGRSVDTSMGFTPLEGCVMGTRCGDVDAGALIHLMRETDLDADGLERVLNRDSGLKGLSGVSQDMREVMQAADNGNHQAQLAFKTFCYRIRKYIGAYLAAMGGLDALVFTGGIGQGSAGIRSQACQGLSCMGIHLDEARNQRASVLHEPSVISSADSPVKVLVIPADEERMIAHEALETVQRMHISQVIHQAPCAPISIEVSAHHVHLCQDHIGALFGAGHALTSAAPLSQPGQFAAREKVTLKGPKGCVDRVRVLGPARMQSQVEIAMTEQFKLGIEPPIRASGDLANTPGITLEGPSGTVHLEQGVICALRHLHMTPTDALSMGLRDRDIVRVRVDGDRELIFGDVLVRVNPHYQLAMHIDTDEANAANIHTGMTGHICEIQNRGTG